MEVRLKTGWKAGQLEDVSPEAAKVMLADGRATDPRDEEEERIAQLQSNDQAPAPTKDDPPADKRARKAKK